jgi:DNA adenine methylase
VPLNKVESGERYKGAEAAVTAMRKRHPNAEFYGVGHSLAGAIIDSMIDKKLLDGGKTYNPAVQTQHLGKESAQQRIYQEGDILGKLGKPFLPGAEYRDGSSGNFLQAHDLGNFQGGIAPYLCRVGSKKRFAELLDYITPPHKVYIEPFVGSGAFYWYKEPAEREVINDLDKDIAETFRLLKTADTNIEHYPKGITNVEAGRRWFRAHPNPKHKTDRLVYQLMRHCAGYMGTRVKDGGKLFKLANIYKKLELLPEYKARMKNTKVVSKDYAKVISENNTKDSFFFLDPPYENSEGLDYAKGSEAFDFQRLKKALDTIKGHWLMTINDSPHIRGIFKGYHISPVIIKGHKAGSMAIGFRDRKELLISNYALPRGWREHTGKTLKGGGQTITRVLDAAERFMYPLPAGLPARPAVVPEPFAGDVPQPRSVEEYADLIAQRQQDIDTFSIWRAYYNELAQYYNRVGGRNFTYTQYQEMIGLLRQTREVVDGLVQRITLARHAIVSFERDLLEQMREDEEDNPQEVEIQEELLGELEAQLRGEVPDEVASTWPQWAQRMIDEQNAYFAEIEKEIALDPSVPQPQAGAPESAGNEPGTLPPFEEGAFEDAAADDGTGTGLDRDRAWTL